MATSKYFAVFSFKFTYLVGGGGGGGSYAMTCMWQSEDSLLKSVLSFHHMYSENQASSPGLVVSTFTH